MDGGEKARRLASIRGKKPQSDPSTVQRRVIQHDRQTIGISVKTRTRKLRYPRRDTRVPIDLSYRGDRGEVIAAST
jgi:hypothetical protein